MSNLSADALAVLYSYGICFGFIALMLVFNWNAGKQPPKK